MAELVGRTTRGLFRDLTSDHSAVDRIKAAFEDEGFAPDLSASFGGSGVRRLTTQRYLVAIDWTDHSQVQRFLRVAQRILGFVDDSVILYQQFCDALRADGFEVDDRSRITFARVDLSIASIAALRDPSAILDGLERISRAADDGDPALAIGCAKELVESTAKVVLKELGLPYSDRDKLPKLVGTVQGALGLDPKTTSGPDGSDEIRRILGAVSTIPIGLAELRNRGHGTGHGLATARIGLSRRHAHLAANAARTWCQLMLDTLADPQAPWRRLGERPS